MVDTKIEKLPAVDKKVGIDLGLKYFAILSDGTKIENPKWLRKTEGRIRKIQRDLFPITENLQLEVIAVDEYYGSGEYEKYVAIEHFVITEDATEKDVNRLIEFIKIYLV